MKPRADNFIQHTGTMVPQKVQEMEFDQSSIAHLMTVLTDLYSDKALAVIREYSTNALDSQRSAGNEAPIEVDLPSQMKPVFVVRDRGIGMSVDDITDHFSKYGASSKRGDNDAVGMLGLGCKSGLTYTNQFTLTAVKNGVKTTALVTRNPEGKGVIQIMDTLGTNEPNGVEIQIPVKAPIREFVDKANKFFSFWEPGAVLVNSAAPRSYFDGENDDNLFIDPDILVVKDGSLDSDYVVMGNVAYPASIGHGYRAKVIARVQIGDVDFVPSREALQMTSATTEAVANMQHFVQERLEMHIQREIDSCTTKADAIKAAIRWDGLVHTYRKRPTYRGIVLPGTLAMTGQSWTMGSYRGAATQTSYLNVKDLVKEGCYVMVGHPPRSMTQDVKAAIRREFPDAKLVYAVHTMMAEHRAWLAAGQVFHFDRVRPPKQPRIKGQRGSNPRYSDGGGRWLCWERDIRFETVDIPADTDSRIVYITKTDTGWSDNTRDGYRRRMGEALQGLKAPFYLVLLSSTQVDRFKKACPGAIYGQDFFQQQAEWIRSELTDDQFWWGIRREWRLQLAKEKILDPVAAALYARMAACETEKAIRLNTELDEVCRFTNLTGTAVRFDNRTLADARVATVTTLPTQMLGDDATYPLRNGSQIKQTVEYMNAMFLYRSGKCKKS